MEHVDRLKDMHEPAGYGPEGTSLGHDQRAPNKGELVFPEKGPANPLKDEATRRLTHRGGLTDARTEHY